MTTTMQHGVEVVLKGTCWNCGIKGVKCKRIKMRRLKELRRNEPHRDICLTCIDDIARAKRGFK